MKSVEGYVGVHVRLQESDFSLRVTFIQRYLQERTQVRVRPNQDPEPKQPADGLSCCAAAHSSGEKLLQEACLTLLLPTVANTSGSPSLLCQLNWTPNSGWPWSSCTESEW